MIKKFVGLVLVLVSLCGLAHTEVTTTILQLPQVLTAAQQLPQTGVVKAYQRQHDGHEGTEGSVLLYLDVSNQYIHQLYPLIKSELQQQYPDIKPSHNSLGAHITLYDNAPTPLLTLVNHHFNFTVAGVQLIRITKTYNDTDRVFRTYYVGLTIDAPQLQRTLDKLDPSWNPKYLHLSIAEWHE